MRFDYLSWEAFATLLTGLVAIAAAYLVGLRQAKILERQAEIEAIKVRVELFDRRMKIVELHAKLASLHYNFDTRLPFVRDFIDLRGSVGFLFDQQVAQLFDRAYEIGVDLDAPADGERVQQRAEASENRRMFLVAVEPYMRLEGVA